jgi:SAM-dependent methyltransferase
MGLNRDLERQLQLSGYGAEGFAERYDAFRPRPPAALLELLPSLAGGRPRLVVDVGAGTGLSTRPWAAVADAVVGIEPSEAMRSVAQEATSEANVGYRDGSSYASGLDDGCADIVTCSQSLQWMQPEPTFAEFARILRPGGVLAAYQYELLVTAYWEPDAAFLRVRDRVGAIGRELGVREQRPRWPIAVETFEQSGQFSDVRELYLHSVEEGDAERLVGFALSEGSTTTLLDQGYSEAELGLDVLLAAAGRWLVDAAPWWLGYRVIVARTALA